MEHDPLKAGLRAIPKTRSLIAKELRDMATASTEDYRQFAYIAPWIRSIWHAAADLLEDRQPPMKNIDGIPGIKN